MSCTARSRLSCGVTAGLLLLGACNKPHAPVAPGMSPAAPAVAQVDDARLKAANGEPGEWFTPGRDRAGTYYSPLELINDHNVQRLGFAWEYALGTKRGQESTPIVIDGVLYASGNWGRVYALDAASGREVWTYDPQVSGRYGRAACCDAVNRGLAVWKGRVYVISLDGYLDALDARTGRRVWRADTLPARSDKGFNYFSTGAPVVAGEVIVVGNGGADFRGARGSVSAYALDSGTFRWRFWTVPRDPRLGPQEQPHLEKAVATWPKHYDWGMGGGGTAWDALAYDPELGLVYFGTANASPYHGPNDPHYQGDELYVASIIAVHATTGRMAWYYQEIPGEGSDYDTTNKLVLADLEFQGKPSKVILQASKNGYLYVLDRVTGEFLSGKPFAYVNWTRGLDPVTHRPIPNPGADWGRKPVLLYPSAPGAHGWQPMSFDLKSRLLYIPVIDAPMIYVDTTHRRAGLIEGNFDLAFFFPEDYDPKGLSGLLGHLPSLQSLSRDGKVPRSRGLIRAIEPLTGRIVWEQETPTLWDGGVLSTAGNLVFRGDADGYLNVFAADTGKLLKRVDVGTSIMAAPMTYSVSGTQYVAVMAGYGGGVLFNPFPKESAAYRYGNNNRIVAFRLDGGETPKPAPLPEETVLDPPPREGTPQSVRKGEVLYSRYCSRCHAFGRALLPDLRQLPPEIHAIFYDIVLEGAFEPKGMARWDDVLSRPDAEAIHAYLVDQAWQMADERKPGAKP